MCFNQSRFCETCSVKEISFGDKEHIKKLKIRGLAIHLVVSCILSQYRKSSLPLKERICSPFSECGIKLFTQSYLHWECIQPSKPPQIHQNFNEPPHDKSNKKWHVCPVKTQISLGVRPVLSESSLSGWRMPKLIWVRWVHMSFCYFCHEMAHFKTSIFFLFLYILPYALADILGRFGLQEEGLQVTILNFRGVL